MLKDLCKINGASGNEFAVREYIISQIDGKCEYIVDPLGSIIATVGQKNNISINAHMDEIGFITTGITDDGYIRFDSVGEINSKACIDKVVAFENGVKGVIGDKAFHLLDKDEREKCPSIDKLLIDIGASSKQEAENAVSLGDYIYFDSNFAEIGNGFVKSKALDDRIGCQLMIDLINDGVEAVYCFNTQNNVGARGAKCTANRVKASVAIVLDSAVANDLDGVSEGEKISSLGKGAVISIIDTNAIYNKELNEIAIDLARKNEIKLQVKSSKSGKTEAGAIQLSGEGARTMAISLPVRYTKTASPMAKISDIEDTKMLLKELIPRLYDL